MLLFRGELKIRIESEEFVSSLFIPMKEDNFSITRSYSEGNLVLGSTRSETWRLLIRSVWQHEKCCENSKKQLPVTNVRQDSKNFSKSKTKNTHFRIKKSFFSRSRIFENRISSSLFSRLSRSINYRSDREQQQQKRNPPKQQAAGVSFCALRY
jgi:hypothetical protein